VATGVSLIDDLLGGGLHTGQITELVSTGPGGQLVLVELLVATRKARQRVVLVDAANQFAPESVTPDALRHLVLVRTQKLEQALAAADIAVRDGNYAAMVLDVRGVPQRALERTPKTLWHRLRQAAEGRPSAVLIQTLHGIIPAVPWRLSVELPVGLQARRMARGKLLERLSVTLERGHAAEELSA
jgi:RecA/RadA recombinase